jgi:hypothetical protein
MDPTLGVAVIRDSQEGGEKKDWLDQETYQISYSCTEEGKDLSVLPKDEKGEYP